MFILPKQMNSMTQQFVLTIRRIVNYFPQSFIRKLQKINWEDVEVVLWIYELFNILWNFLQNDEIQIRQNLQANDFENKTVSRIL